MTMVRRAVIEDMAEVAAAHRTTMRVSLPYLPELHTPDEDLAYFRDVQFDRGEIWVAEVSGAIVGYAARSPGWLDQLYVLPDHQGRGVGEALLATVLAGVDVLRLWTFQRNLRARRFYEAHGFVLERLTDGAANEEREPDALYRWSRVGISND